MRILVTGGAGLIGSHLCEKLLAQGHYVIALDNFMTGRRENLADFINHPNFEFHEFDVIQPFEPKPAQLEQFSTWLVRPARLVTAQHPIETHLVNSVGTHNLLKLALNNEAKFIVTSTSEIYGDPLEHPQREDYWGNVNPIGPRSCYDESKRFTESLTMEYVRQFGLDARIVRLFNTYGPRNDPNDGRVVPNFIMQALKGEALTIYGDGSQTRSFCYVSDLIEGLHKSNVYARHQRRGFQSGQPGRAHYFEFCRNHPRSLQSRTANRLQAGPPDDPTRVARHYKGPTRLGWEPKSLWRRLDLTLSPIFVSLPLPSYDFPFEGTKADVEQMLGNAVPVKLAQYVANCIKEYLENEQPFQI